jgi:hypothetical protein
MAQKITIRFSFIVFVPILLTTVAMCYGQKVWEPVSSLPQDTYLYSVTYGNNQFVAVGYKGVVLVSTDGLKWSTKTLELPGEIINTLLSETVPPFLVHLMVKPGRCNHQVSHATFTFSLLPMETAD